MMKFIKLFILIGLVWSCDAGKSHQNETTANENIVIESNSNLKTDSLFDDFFDQFMWDQEFQKSRVVFPFKQDTNSFSTANNWKHIPFYTQSEYIPILSSDTVEFYGKNILTTKVEMLIIDFKRKGVNKYNFKKINEKWFLVNSENLSIKHIPEMDFIDFLTKFSNDSIFQINHTSFPLQESIADPDNNYETTKKTISLNDWEHINLVNFINPLMVFSKIEIENRYRNIFFRGVENGIWMKYTFEKISGNWKLIKLEDYST